MVRNALAAWIWVIVIKALSQGKDEKVDIIMEICYRTPNQNEPANEMFCKQLEVSWPLAHCLIGTFNFPEVCWKYTTAKSKLCWRFLQCVEDNFLRQMVRQPTREDGPLVLFSGNREALMGDVRLSWQSNHEMIGCFCFVLFLTLTEERMAISRTATLDFQGAGFNLFREQDHGIL